MNLIEVPPPKESNDTEVWQQWLDGIEEFSVDWNRKEWCEENDELYEPFKSIQYHAIIGHRGVMIAEKKTGEYIWGYNIEMGYKIAEVH